MQKEVNHYRLFFSTDHIKINKAHLLHINQAFDQLAWYFHNANNN